MPVAEVGDHPLQCRLNDEGEYYRARPSAYGMPRASSSRFGRIEVFHLESDCGEGGLAGAASALPRGS